MIPEAGFANKPTTMNAATTQLNSTNFNQAFVGTIMGKVQKWVVQLSVWALCFFK